MSSTVWQYAAGDAERDYGDVCVRFGRAMIGPGELGPFPEHRNTYATEVDTPSGFESFCDEEILSSGDLLALKRPHGRSWMVHAVGEVGHYEWLEQFGDVDGWDLEHTRQVLWRTPPKNEPARVEGLTRGTFKRTPKGARAIRALFEGWELRSPDPLPPVAPILKDNELIESLIDHGLAIAQCETVVGTINRLRRLARWYSRQGGGISEHEIRTFLIVPVMQALGWPEQRMKIEFNNIDLALFDEPAGPGAHPDVIVESKRPYTGLHSTVEQASGYAKRFPKCRALVVSDGFRYRLYARAPKTETGWAEQAYGNLLRLRNRHPYEAQVGGGTELFRRLLAPQGPLS